jgi:prepilin-type N-terminal cleavage/methylation domain-containing protein
VNRIPTARADTGTLPRGSKRGFSLIELVIVIVILLVLAALLLPNIRSAGPAARRTQCRNNLKQIVIALRNYEDIYHALPPAYTVDAHGKRLHSWRALILPYLDQQGLYKQIDFSKAWDDPANGQAFAKSLDVYHCPEDRGPLDHTTYLAVVTPKSCLRPANPRLLSEIKSPSSTVVLIEVDSAHAVHWMDPSDADEALVLGLNSKSALPHSGGLLVALVDGSVQNLNADISPAIRRALISTAEADKVALDAEAVKRALE